MFESNHGTLREAEAAAQAGCSVQTVLHILRQMPLADFTTLMWSMPISDYPAISLLLPRMASAEAQLGWTGKAGTVLAEHTVDFVRIMAMLFQTATGRRLDGQRILDFGFGYGRIARLIYWFTDPKNFYGVDPMQSSLDICRDMGVLGQLSKVSYLPETLNLSPEYFDLVFAYSVFTHTSLSATLQGLRNLRRVVRHDGLAVVTIRPIEHWDFVSTLSPEQKEQKKNEHRSTGFAFDAYEMPGSDAYQLYGENSITLDWIDRSGTGWEVVGHDRGIDGLQTIVALAPV